PPTPPARRPELFVSKFSVTHTPLQKVSPAGHWGHVQSAWHTAPVAHKEPGGSHCSDPSTTPSPQSTPHRVCCTIGMRRANWFMVHDTGGARRRDGPIS